MLVLAGTGATGIGTGTCILGAGALKAGAGTGAAPNCAGWTAAGTKTGAGSDTRKKGGTDTTGTEMNFRQITARNYSGQFQV